MIIRLILTCLILPLLSGGQTLSYHTLSVEDGLLANEIHFAMQDSEGYVWFGTKNGASRWDSKNFRNFTIADGLPNNEVIYIYEDSDHRIWFSCLSKKLSYYYKGSIHNTSTDPFLRMIDIYPGSRLAELDHGLYYGSVRHKLHKYILGRDENIEVKTNFVNNFYFINYQNKVWIIDYFYPRNNLVASETDSFRVPLLLQPNFPDPALITKVDYANKRYYFQYGLDTPFYAASYRSGEFKSAVFNKGNIVELYKDRLVFTRSGRTIPVNFNGMPVYSVNGNIVFLGNENMWIDRQQTLLEYKMSDIYEQTFKHLFVKDKRIYGINKAMEVIDLAKSQIVSKIREPVLNAYNGVQQDDGYLLATSRKLYNVRGASLNVKYFNDHRIVDFKHISAGKKNGSYFTANGTRGIFELNFRTQHHRNIYNDPYTPIYSVFEDCSGRLWFSSDNQVFYTKYYGSKIKNVNVFVLDTSRKMFCSSISEDCMHNLFFVTGAGIYLFDGKMKYLLDKSNLLTDDICNKLVMDDRDSTLWVATNNGLDHLKITTQEGRLRFRTVNRFFKADGLFSNTINDILLHDGKLYIATDKGVNVLEDLDYNPDAQKIPVYLRPGTVAGNDRKPIPLRNNCQLDYTHNSLSLHFSALYFVRRDRLKVKAFLHRDDKLIANNDITGDEINYFSLSNGRYKLVLYVYDQDYPYISGSSLPFYFTIRPPYYKTVWFITASCLLLTSLSMGLLLLGIVRRKNRQLKEGQMTAALNMSALKSLQNQMNPHFIFNSLNAVQYFITHKEERSALDYLSEFSDLIREMLEQSRNALIAIEDEIDFLKKYISLELIRFQYSFEVSWTIELDEQDLCDIYIPTMLVQPILENAVRHGVSTLMEEKGKIDIWIFLENDQLLGIRINNNGSAGGGATGNSIAIKTIRERLHLYTKNGINGKYQLDTSAKGASAFITIPI